MIVYKAASRIRLLAFYADFLRFSEVFQCESSILPLFTSVHNCGTVRVNALKSKSSHSKPLKIKRKHALCEWVNVFLGNKKRIYVRA